MEGVPPLLSELRHGRGPLDPDSELVEIIVEKDEDGDRLIQPLVQILVHEVHVLVLGKNTEVQLVKFLGQATDNGEVGDHVAAPVFGNRKDVDRTGKTLEKLPFVVGELELAL